MKKIVLFFIASVLSLHYSLQSQTLDGDYDYISEIKGDTLVIKDYYEMNNEPNSLYFVMISDSVNVPAGRVYELKTNGYYPNSFTLSSSNNQGTVIIGANSDIMVNNKDENSVPPLICNEAAEIIVHPFGLEANNDLTIKNCMLSTINYANDIGWAFAATNDSNLNLLFENCLFEYTLWTFVSSTDTNCSFVFRDCYFVNMTGRGWRDRPVTTGGVFDSFTKQDTLLVENCTHVIAQGNLYNLKDNPFNRIIVNHNTFINSAGHPLLNIVQQMNTSFTNNILINCNILPYNNCVIYDAWSTGGPTGIINLESYIDVKDAADTKYLAQNNLVYWNSYFTDSDSILNAATSSESDCWSSQIMIMNSKTQEKFDDDESYPYLVNDNWIVKKPEFTNTQNLFTEQVEILKNSIIDTNLTRLPEWRLTNTSYEKLVYPDWPIPIDLAYNDPDLLTGGIGEFPLGDLNWFPNKKSEWLSQRSSEYEKIHNALNKGELVTNIQSQENLPVSFQLYQNYPNPFNLTTKITFSVPKAANISLKVYSILGEEVATLVDGFITPQTFITKFDGTNFASGVYFIRLTSADVDLVKKMLLLK